MRVSTSAGVLSVAPIKPGLSRWTVLLFAGNLMCAGTALADEMSSSVSSVYPKRIEVLSNGQVYTQPAIPLVSLSASLVVNIDSEFSGRIKSWKAWVSFNPQAPANASAVIHFSQHPHSVSYPAGSRPKTVSTRGVNINVPYGTLAPTLIAHCNALADKLHTQGMSNQEIFSQDRVIPVHVLSNLEADISGIGTATPPEVGANIYKSFELVCKGQGGVNPDIGPVAGGIKAKTEARLTSITASVLHDSHPASCPTEATARVTFVSDTEGPFTWRFTSASGKVSPPIRMEMRASDKQGNLYIRSYDQKFMVGEKPSPTGGGGSGPGIGGSAAGGGLAGNPQPGPGKSGVGHQQVGGGYAAPALPNLPPAHQDGLRAVVLNAAPGSVEHSAPASYHVQCPVVRNPAVGNLPGELQGSASPSAQPAGAASVLVPGAVKTAPPTGSLPPGVRNPVSPEGKRVVPTVVPATPVARPPVPSTGAPDAGPARTPRIGALRRQAAEEGRTGVR
jgi:hypothetical protein